MLKSEALRLLGGSLKSAAKHIGITPQAISGWPDELTPPIRDRVQAALWRELEGRRLGQVRESQSPDDQLDADCGIGPHSQSESMQ